MTVLGLILGWLFGILFGVVTLSMFLTKNFFQAVVLLVAVLLLIPPVSALVKYQFGKPIPPFVRIIGAVVMISLFGWSMAQQEQTSIFFTLEHEAKMNEIYESKLAQWPTPYATTYVETSFGKVYVIISGPEEAPPILLLNAGQMAAWSWVTNVGALNEHYRTYAVGTIGEVSRSVLSDINHYPQNGKEWSDLLVEITDALGIEKTLVVGASNGGFLATNYAIYYPERVEALALLGPMGLTPSTNENIVRIALAQLFPLKIVQDNTITWSFGEDPELLAQIEDWFRLVLKGAAPKQSPPITMKAEELQQVSVPTLLVIGKSDNLMGDLNAVRELASNVPGIEIVEIEAAHLMGIENPEVCNQLILDFFDRP